MSLHLYLSSMFAGKTSYLAHLLQVDSQVQKPLYINSKLDTRSEKGISTHNPLLNFDGLNVDMVQVSNLAELSDDFYKKYSMIAIDEAQFIPDIVKGVLHLVEDLNIEQVHVGALSGDYKRDNFGDVHKLIPLADDVTMLRKMCCQVCAQKKIRSTALFTHKMSKTDKQIEIGSDDYIPVCRKCYLALNKFK